MNNISSTPVIGWREWVALPELGIQRIKAKIDTGARTSALHAFIIEPFRQSSRDKIRFYIHPIQKNIEEVIVSTADILDIRTVTDSGGHSEQRFIIETLMCIGSHEQRIEISLTNRDNMRFRMLLGRSAVKKHYLIDAASSYLLGQKEFYHL